MFTLRQDNSSHWYVIPVSKADEWDEWMNISEDDQRAWIVPEFAQAINGSYTQVTFPSFETKY